MMREKFLNKGDILNGENNFSVKGENIHYIVYLKDLNGSDFIGTSLTHSKFKGQNVKMESSHIQTGLEFKYDNTYFIPKKFIKIEAYGPFKKVGELTEEGIVFVDSFLNKIDDFEAITWEDFLNSNTL